MKNLKSLTQSRKLKHSTLNLIFVAIVVAIIITINSIVSILGSTFGWYLDMTEEELYSVSDELIALLDNVSNDAPIDIIFCCDKDEAEGNYTDAATGTGSAMAYIHSTATQIADRLDNVTVLYKDPIKDHAFIDQFSQAAGQLKPSEASIIIARRDANGNYGTMYRTYHATSFYTFTTNPDGSNQLHGYSGERTFATAITSLSYDKAPTVYFVWGHGENVPYSSVDGNYNVPELARVFIDCGFRVRQIFLDDEEMQFTCKTQGCGESWGKKEIGELTDFMCECGTRYNPKEDESLFNEKRTIPSDARAIIINDPKSDYGANELSKLSDYLVSKRGTLMCFANPKSADPLDNLSKFVKQETGVTMVGGDYVTHKDTVTQGQLYDFKGIIPNTKAAEVYLSALQGFGSKRPMLKDSGILKIDEKFMSDEAVSDVLADRVTQPIIQTDTNAYFDGAKGTYNVLSVTALTTMYNNQPVQSYFMVCPSINFASDEYLSNSMYANEDILLALIHSTTSANVPVDLDFKEFANYQLDISSSQATTVFVCLITILPILVIGTGIVIIVRRKHR